MTLVNFILVLVIVACIFLIFQMGRVNNYLRNRLEEASQPKVVVVERNGAAGYKAYVKKHDILRAGGLTSGDEAIGALVRIHSDYFGVDIRAIAYEEVVAQQ
jgi:hypothetical protein